MYYLFFWSKFDYFSILYYNSQIIIHAIIIYGKKFSNKTCLFNYYLVLNEFIIFFSQKILINNYEIK